MSQNTGDLCFVSLVLTCTETGESRFLSPLHVKHRKTNPNITVKIVDGVEKFLHVQEGPKVHPAG